MLQGAAGEWPVVPARHVRGLVRAVRRYLTGDILPLPTLAVETLIEKGHLPYPEQVLPDACRLLGRAVRIHRTLGVCDAENPGAIEVHTTTGAPVGHFSAIGTAEGPQDGDRRRALACVREHMNRKLGGRAPIAPMADWRTAAIEGITLSGADTELAAALVDGDAVNEAARRAARHERQVQGREYLVALTDRLRQGLTLVDVPLTETEKAQRVSALLEHGRRVLEAEEALSRRACMTGACGAALAAVALSGHTDLGIVASAGLLGWAAARPATRAWILRGVWRPDLAAPLAGGGLGACVALATHLLR